MKGKRVYGTFLPPNVLWFTLGWGDTVLFVCCRVHMPLSIKGDAFGEDGSIPSGAVSYTHLPKLFEEYDELKLCAICSYVPDFQATEMVRKTFPNVFCYYPCGV